MAFYWFDILIPMKQLQIIGTQDDSIAYTDRPTVKVVVRRGDEILLLNKGLLPGGGVDTGEADAQAIQRELLEEIGMNVKNIQPIGEIIQYRNFIQKKYVIHGYTAEFDAYISTPLPQDAGEASFRQHWMKRDDAVQYVSESIKVVESVVMLGDAIQGRLYNLMTSLALIKAIQ